jgi:predicted dehydrogenase
VKIPDGVDDVDASFVTVGAIALQGVRQAEPVLGDKVAVVGLGLLGQLTVQLLKTNGCKVLGTDLDPDKLELAQKLGADLVCPSGDLLTAAANFSNGYGVDSVIITASTSSNQPVVDAGEISRTRGKVVVVGMVGMDIPRNVYYKKELDVRLSMAYGPGRYDPQYEEKGIDYPFPYVRWTEQRNFEAFLGLVQEGRVTPKALITHQFDFDDALKAYDLLEGKSEEKYLGIVLNYPEAAGYAAGGIKDVGKTISLKESQDAGIRPQDIRYALIGAGNFTKSVVLPTLKKVGGFEPVILCTSTGVSGHGTGTRYGFTEITTDNETIFADDKVNTVLITTRHDTHAEYVIKALKAGKHVFVEKPLCLNEAELDEIETVYKSPTFAKATAGKQITNHPSSLNKSTQSFDVASESRILTVGYNRRFSPLIRKMKEKVGDRPMAITYRVNAGVIPGDVWIQDAEIGGGRIIGEVCHFVDTCSFLTGSDPFSVFAACVRKDGQSIPDEDNVSIVISYANGSTATINYLAYGDRQLPKEHIELFCGNIAMQMIDFRQLNIYKGGKKERFKNSNQDKGFAAEFKAFKEAISTGMAPIPFDSLVATTRATFLVLESLRTGQPRPMKKPL